MAELTVGIIALAGLFNNAVDCFEYVQIGKNCTKDFTTYQLRLDCARLQLSCWGDIVGLGGDLQLRKTQQDAMLGSQQEKDLAQRLLTQIIDLFSEVQFASSKYKMYGSSNDDSLKTYSPEADLEEHGIVLHQRMRNLSLKRRNSEKLSNKIKWALYEERHFSRLVQDIAGLVGQLESRFPLVQPALLKACEEDVAQLGSAKDLATLKPNAEREDKNLAAAIGQVVQSQSSVAGGVRMRVKNNWGAVLANNPGSITINNSRPSLPSSSDAT